LPSDCHTIKHENGAVAARHGEQIVDRIDGDRATLDLRIRTANGAFRSHITLAVKRKDQNPSPIGHEDLPVHDIDREPVRPVQISIGSLDKTDRGFLTVCAASEREDCVGERVGHQDLVIHGVVPDVVHRSAQH